METLFNSQLTTVIFLKIGLEPAAWFPQINSWHTQTPNFWDDLAFEQRIIDKQ